MRIQNCYTHKRRKQWLSQKDIDLSITPLVVIVHTAKQDAMDIIWYRRAFTLQ